jgi:hypothetical protein
MSNEYDFIDSDDHPRREFGAGDVLVGWVIYVAAVLYLIV